MKKEGSVTAVFYLPLVPATPHSLGVTICDMLLIKIKEMPRKPTRCRPSPRPLPFTFSPFFRTVAQVASYCKANHQIHESKFHKKSPPNAAGNGIINHALEEKSKQSESSDEDGSEVVAQADFAFFDPKPDDFHGVKILLQTYLDNKLWDLSGFVDLILGQTTVGTVVKIEDDEDDGVFSLITTLNLGRYKAMHFNSQLLMTAYLLAWLLYIVVLTSDLSALIPGIASLLAITLFYSRGHKCLMELKEFLLDVGQEKDVKDALRLLLGEEAQNVGLLVSQRVVNLPPQLLPPLYDALFDEISWATEDEPTEELRSSFCFKFFY
ncbi:Protein BCCIP-like [Vitis vinifera]|uniref:Protein BCCIP-like n=1 Tax=Vitis vinifera TaxID=29760 RepID=A0A438EKQ1_VITVI|nr:Protein BCCIP-like [Vitis vinifera]